MSESDVCDTACDDESRQITSTPAVLLIAAVSLLALMAVTWRLWVPLNGYPRVPLLSIGLMLPSVIDGIAATLLIGSVLASLLPQLGKLRGRCLLAAAVALAILFVTDQHRLQPWAFESLWIFVALALCRERVALRWIRFLVISIYFWSGVSKLDSQFAHTTGREFLVGLSDLLGQTVDAWPESVRIATTLALPLVELCIAVLLIFPKTRRIAVAGGVAMHAVLIVLLSPLGLNHQPAVLLWNATSALLTVALFRRPTVQHEEVLSGQPRFQGFAIAMICLVIVLPLAEPWGRYDHWLAWGLYAPHNSRVVLLVNEEVVGRLPKEVRKHVVRVDDVGGTTQLFHVRLDRWSIASQSVPIYPQQRFQAGVAYWIIRRSDLRSGFQVHLQSASDRRTGERSTVVVSDVDHLRMQLSRYGLNAFPRDVAI
ncbi:MAG: hypothetical protein R3C05_25235 [Pirellulaceae bacterium]